ncbi:hypothetical protein CDV31_017197, partial [Fusarium ambrosium]
NVDTGQDRPRPSGLPDGDGIAKEGDDWGQFSESDIDAEDYFNLLLSPVRPRRYLEQIGVECDSDPGDGDESDGNDSVDEGPVRHRSGLPSARLRTGRRGLAPGTGGRPRRSQRQTRSLRPPRRIRSPVRIPPEESAVFHAQDPVWNGDIMMEFDKYNGPVFLTTPDGKKIVPILPVERDFLVGATLCARTQFPLMSSSRQQPAACGSAD